MCYKKLAVPGIVAAFSLAGCNSVRGSEAGLLDPGMGEAVAYAKAAHVIDPDPVYVEGDAEPGSSGAKAAAAARRYRTDQVKRIERVSTSEVGQEAAAGGGGPRSN